MRSTPWVAAARPPGRYGLYPGFALTAIILTPPLPRPMPHGRYLVLSRRGCPWARIETWTRRFPDSTHAVVTGLQYAARRRGADARTYPVPLVYRVPSWPPTQRLGLPYALDHPTLHPRAMVYLLPSALWDWDTPLAELTPWCALLPHLTPSHTVVFAAPPWRTPERVHLARRVLRAAVPLVLPLAEARRVARWL